MTDPQGDPRLAEFARRVREAVVEVPKRGLWPVLGAVLAAGLLVALVLALTIGR